MILKLIKMKSKYFIIFQDRTGISLILITIVRRFYFKEIPDFEVKSSYDLVINATSHLLPFENFSNQVDRSTLIDESAFIIEELDGDIGFALLQQVVLVINTLVVLWLFMIILMVHM